MKELIKQIRDIEKLYPQETEEVTVMHFGKHDTTLGTLVDSAP